MAKAAEPKKRGRRPVDENRTFVGVVISNTMLRRIDRYAVKAFGMGRSDAIRDLLESALKAKGM